MANQQSSKGPSLIGQTIGPTAPVVAGEDNSGLVKPLQIDASGNLKVAVTGAGSGGTSSVDEAAFTAGVSAGTPAMGVYEAAPTALADGQLGIVALDANRNVKVNIVAGSSGNAAASATGAAVPASADYVGFQNPAGNLEGFALESLDYDTDPASQPQTVIGIALPAAGGPVAGGTNTNPIQVGDAGGSLTVDGSLTSVTTVTTVTGITNVVHVDDNGGSLTVDGTVAVSGVSGNVTVVQGTATNLKAQAEVYQGGTAVGAAAPLQVSLANTGANATAVKVDGSAVTQPVSGTVTANAGTDLNTSALAIETGGNLAAAATSLAIMDDWDETDRAKVNVIAGQVGITAGAGAVAANTPRTTLASDDPAVAVLGATSGAKVIADANGTIQQYLRGLVYEAIQTRNLKLAYNASSSITVTNLQSLATSATWVAGWESGAIDNSSNLFCDYAINADIVVGAAPTAGEIRMYLVAEMDDSTWPDVFDGTESTETVSDTQTRDAICRLAAITVTDATASQHWYLMCPSVAQVFGGWVPRKFVVFITHSTVQALAAAGNAVYVRGAYYTVA